MPDTVGRPVYLRYVCESRQALAVAGSAGVAGWGRCESAVAPIACGGPWT
jgi:hypothetical protein